MLVIWEIYKDDLVVAMSGSNPDWSVERDNEVSVSYVTITTPRTALAGIYRVQVRSVETVGRANLYRADFFIKGWIGDQPAPCD